MKDGGLTPAELLEFERAVLATMQRHRERIEQECARQLEACQRAARNLLEHERGALKAEELLS